jgi:hypothetical protein
MYCRVEVRDVRVVKRLIVLDQQRDSIGIVESFAIPVLTIPTKGLDERWEWYHQDKHPDNILTCHHNNIIKLRQPPITGEP